MNFKDQPKTIQGDKAENAFISTIKKIIKNVIVYTADTFQNRIEHWDYRINNIKIDVKAIKDCHINDTRYTIVEFLDTYMHKGWLYGEADYIVFQSGTSDNYQWLMVDRLELMDYCQHNVKMITVPDLSQSINKLFSRGNDLMTVVDMTYLECLPKSKIIRNK